VPVPIAVVALIAINVVVSLFGFRAMQGGDATKSEPFLFIPFQVARGENGVGLLLAHFAHANGFHLLFNMLALYSFAGPVVHVLGTVWFIGLYLAAGLGADLVVFALHRDDRTYRCLGASGSVFGIVMAAIVLDPTTSVAFMFVPVPIPGPLFMVAYAVISGVLIARRHRGGISHEAHVGGALLGLALTGVLSPRGLTPLMRWFSQWL
jgi:membrane associated rhomboid family serine protease